MTPWAKRLAILLAVSFALNLLLAGFLLGRGLHRPRERWASPPTSVGAMNARHPALRKALADKGPEMFERRKASQQARGAVAKALEQQPFERSVLDAALGALRAETGRSQELLHRELGESAEKGSAEARRDLAKAFRRRQRGD